ncbi:hypothetical protein BZA77DRAFT_295204 [Pyronema omphalodes]|nr:hypothetical protein BZA77DRAFT_295204 [Pyronema omphalodes]
MLLCIRFALSSCQQVQDSGHDLNSAAKEIQPSSSSVPTSVGDVTQRLSQLHLGDPVNASLHSNQVDSVSNLSYPPMIQESRKVHEPRDVSHRFISQSYHVEETVGQQPQSLASQSGQSSVFPSGQEDEVAQKAKRMPSVFNHTQGRPENSEKLDHPRDTTESLEYTTGRPSDREHHTADPLIGLLPWSTGEEKLLTSRNAQYEIHSSEKGDGNHIDSAGPADSSTSYVLPNSIALSNKSHDHWQHDMETLSLPRTDNGLLNKHEVIQKLLDILSTCDGAQRQFVFATLLAIDEDEARQMPGTLVILIDEIIHLTQQLARS